jgi:hypothetical protein
MRAQAARMIGGVCNKNLTQIKSFLALASRYSTLLQDRETTQVGRQDLGGYSGNYARLFA